MIIKISSDIPLQTILPPGDIFSGLICPILLENNISIMTQNGWWRFKAHKVGRPSVSLSLLRVPVEVGCANDSGMATPRVASSFNFDRSTGREFKLWKSKCNFSFLANESNYALTWPLNPRRYQKYQIYTLQKRAEYIHVVMTYSLLSARCIETLQDLRPVP